MNIETERLLLKPLSEEYAESIFRHFTEQVTKYMFPTPAKNIDETRGAINEFIEQRKNETDHVFVILSKTNKEFIGMAGLHNLNDKIPELGIWTKIESHGNHYGREVIGGIIEHARELNIKTLLYPVDRRNTASKKIPLYYNGKLVGNKEVKTPDGRILEEEIYEIDI